MSSNEIINMDLIMLSKFGATDGGRETWAYNFLPKLLLTHNVSLNIIGYNDQSTPVHYELLSKLAKCTKHQVNFDILEGNKSNKPKALAMFIKLKRFLKEVKYEAPTHVIAMGMFELIYILTFSRFKNAKKIVWLRGVFLNEKANRIPKGTLWLFKIIERFLLSRVDIILANGDDIRKHYSLNYNVCISVVENGVDINKWCMPPPKLGSVINVAYIGRLSKVKGIEDYIRLIEKVKKSVHKKNFEFHIVGDSGSYSAQVSDLERRKLVNYHGSINPAELPSFLLSMDVCVALTYSSSELGGGGTSNALMEQMAASKIIIAWDNPIFSQLLNSQSAYLVEQYSVSSLFSALTSIYDNKHEALVKSSACMNTIQSYTIESQVDKFVKLIIKEEC